MSNQPEALKVGSRLYSPVSTLEFVVVRAPARPVVVICGGAPMQTSAVLDPDKQQTGSASHYPLGKRYEPEGGGDVELLVVKAGAGPVTVDGAPLVMKAAKKLPSSD